MNVRSGPGKNYKAVNRLSRGDFVNVGDCRRGWCYVDVHGGNGYILERVIGEGANPYNDLGPAEPGYIPPQERGTYRPIDQKTSRPSWKRLQSRFVCFG
ncbi:SH3 domain-containing protein [Agrobacterium cavarae]|uniref:SH3 domain-containing protein n=1 Tax=Agrobacterium cavarae TaxID=2528239 RepID=UPI003EE74532